MTALLMAALAAYRIGLAQGRTEIARLQSDLAVAHELQLATSGRLAAAEQQAEAAITRAAQLLQSERRSAPSPALQRLMAVGSERLQEGLPVDRLEFLLRHASLDRACAAPVDTRRVVVHTPVSTGSIPSVGFADNRIIVTGEGAVARDVDGAAVDRFDPAQSVTLRFLRIDGDVGTAVGRLPLTHATVLGDTEFRFTIRASEQQADAVELSAQRCPFP